MNIDPIARWYRWIEYAAFGRALERRRFAYLDRLSGARRVLILGEGDGRVLERLLAVAPAAEFDVIEMSAEMIALARARIGNSARVRFLHQDALAGELPSASYDGVVTLFFLDCFNEDDLRRVINKIKNAIEGDGIWLVTDFAIPEAGWLRWHARLWIRTMYEFFGMTTGLRVRSLPPIAEILQEAGLRRSEYSTERGGLIRSEVWIKERR